MTQEEYKEYNNLVITTLNELELSKKQKDMLDKLFNKLAELSSNSNGNECNCKPKVVIDISELYSNPSLPHIVITKDQFEAIMNFNAIIYDDYNKFYCYINSIEINNNSYYLGYLIAVEYIDNEYRLYVERPA